jgi:hypothetical protein
MLALESAHLARPAHAGGSQIPPILTFTPTLRSPTRSRGWVVLGVVAVAVAVNPTSATTTTTTSTTTVDGEALVEVIVWV